MFVVPCRPPGHGIAIDGALVPARFLVDGTSVVQDEVAYVDYWPIELARHDLVFAEGLPAESYMDCGNRGAFEGKAGVLDLHPSFAPALSAYASMEDACLPWVMAGRYSKRPWARLAERAAGGTRGRSGFLSKLRRLAA